MSPKSWKIRATSWLPLIHERNSRRALRCGRKNLKSCAMNWARRSCATDWLRGPRYGRMNSKSCARN